MKAAVNIMGGFTSKKEQFQVWKLLDPLQLNLDGDKMNYTIEFVKFILSNDDKYIRTVATPCNEKGKETLPIPLIIMSGHHQPYFLLNVLGYTGDFETGILLK